MLKLGEKIKKLRKEKNITQKTLAKKINTHRTLISMYETNAREPNYEILVKLAQYFEVSTDYLLENNQSDLYTNIRKIRENKKNGINQLSRISGVNTNYISALERGEKQNSTITTLTKISNALEVTISELLYKEQIIFEKSKKNNNSNNSIEDVIKTILYNPLIMEKGNYDIYKLNENEINEFVNDILTFIRILGPKYLK